MFNNVLNNASPNISYNPATGVFTITAAGNYYVNWWMNTDGAGAVSSVIFSVAVAGGPLISASSPAPVVSLQLNGQAFLKIGNVPASISLVNNTGAAVFLGASAVQGDMTILEIL